MKLKEQKINNKEFKWSVKTSISSYTISQETHSTRNADLLYVSFALKISIFSEAFI